jgi:hypothetical protein
VPSLSAQEFADNPRRTQRGNRCGRDNDHNGVGFIGSLGIFCKSAFRLVTLDINRAISTNQQKHETRCPQFGNRQSRQLPFKCSIRL